MELCVELFAVLLSFTQTASEQPISHVQSFEDKASLLEASSKEKGKELAKIRAEFDRLKETNQSLAAQNRQLSESADHLNARVRVMSQARKT